MTRKISYLVRFGVPTELGGKEQMLASIHSLLGAIESFDRLVANSIGVELIYKKELRDMGAAYFDYEVTLFLVWPPQMQLGGYPRPDSIDFIIGQVHQALLKSLDSDSVDAGEFIDNWDKWAKKVGLADSLIYLPPSTERIQPLFDNLGRAAHNLDFSIS